MRCGASVALSALLALAAAGAHAQSVSMSGSLGDKALLIIDGAPRTVATGSTVQGVKLVAVRGSEATVEVHGKRQVLSLGGAQVNLGAAPSDGGGSRIVLTAGSGGHFVTDGAINGQAV
ncbi:MAG: TIGR02281 family clan AA aspartic protease, partial [Burkholderiales bacterium]|nr:TIGR02281 family clan AA aspartic protease [Burkholderiales bacterium]